MTTKMVVLACFVAIAVGSGAMPAYAQPPALLPLPEDISPLTVFHQDAAAAWVAEYDAWEQWIVEWANHNEPGLFHARERRPKPAPPEWLVDACDATMLDEAWLDRACVRVERWRDDFATTRARYTATGRAERPKKSLWWQHVHLDTLWPILSDRGSSIGVVGTHITTEIHGRLQVFVGPGFMLINMPGAHGRAWTPAADWGVAYRLRAFRFPATRSTAVAHLNLAKAWIWRSDSAADGTVDLVGLSLTFLRDTPAPTSQRLTSR